MHAKGRKERGETASTAQQVEIISNKYFISSLALSLTTPSKSISKFLLRTHFSPSKSSSFTIRIVI